MSGTSQVNDETFAVRAVVPEALAEIITGEAADFAPNGILTEDAGTLRDVDLPADSARLTLFVPTADKETAVVGLGHILKRHRLAADVEAEAIVDQDWNAAWKAHYEPVEIGERLRVVPAWWQPDDGETASDRHVVRIDPGQAFGTGTHETTRLMCQMVEAFVVAHSTPKSLRLLDVGTGTGLVALAGVTLGAASAVGVDNDADAIASAHGNLALNEHGNRVTLHVSETPEAATKERFELVAANIISSILIKLRDGIVGRVAPGGTLLLSGVLAEEQTRFESAFLPDGFEVEERFRLAEWVGLRVRAPK